MCTYINTYVMAPMGTQSLWPPWGSLGPWPPRGPYAHVCGVDGLMAGVLGWCMAGM